MIERKCALCQKNEHVDAENSSKVIKFKNVFYHYDCFREFCHMKQKSKMQKWIDYWTEVEQNIDQLVLDTAKDQRDIVFRDDMYWWLVEKYNLSFVSKYFFTKMASIYEGTYPGLAYPITGEELFEEWQYYFDELCSINKNLSGEQLIYYHIGILLSRNAEFREIKQKERIAKEIQEQQQDEIKVQQDTMFILQKNSRQRKNKTADLYKEMIGGEDNG